MSIRFVNKEDAKAFELKMERVEDNKEVKASTKKYVDDETLTWEERYKKLEQHHIEKTKLLIKKINELKCLLEIDV